MTSITALVSLDPMVAVHLFGAVVALVLGPFAIYRKRRDRVHRALGYVWVVAMAVTALSSFGLRAAILPLGFGFGAIHLLSVWVLLQLAIGVTHARLGRIAAHRARMAGLYWQGLTVAGLFTLLPGRIVNQMTFPNRPELGFWVMGLVGLALVWVNLRRSRLAPEVPAQRVTLG